MLSPPIARFGWGRRTLRVLLWTVAVAAGAVAVNLVAIRLLGDIDRWTRWLADHQAHLFLWRLSVYLATGWGWVWMRRRVLLREANPESAARMRRAEVAAVICVTLLEGVLFWQTWHT